MHSALWREFEVVADPFPGTGGIAVRVTTKKDSTIRILQIPATVLRSEKYRDCTSGC